MIVRLRMICKHSEIFIFDRLFSANIMLYLCAWLRNSKKPVRSTFGTCRKRPLTGLKEPLNSVVDPEKKRPARF